MTDPMRRLAPVIRLAPAKVNLTLAVVGRREDGFHALHSVMVPLELVDRLSLAVAGGRGDTLRVEGADTGPAADDLVMRAIAAARRVVGRADRGSEDPAPALAARLEKRIPVAAGLAGGSSDAAAALDGALEAWGASVDPEVRLRLAGELGSDVPFFLAGGSALVEGRGEQVTPLRGVIGPSPGVLLVVPAVAVATPAVFAAFAAGARPGSPGAARLASEHLAAELRDGLDAARLVDRAGVLAAANDLAMATVAVVPGLRTLRRALFRLLGRPVGQSGSGPSLWALYPSREAADAAAETVRAAIADGRLIAPGGAAPSVIVTGIAGGGPAG